MNLNRAVNVCYIVMTLAVILGVGWMVLVEF